MGRAPDRAGTRQATSDRSHATTTQAARNRPGLPRTAPALTGLYPWEKVTGRGTTARPLETVKHHLDPIRQGSREPGRAAGHDRRMTQDQPENSREQLARQA